MSDETEMIVPTLGFAECCVWSGDIRARPLSSLVTPLSPAELQRAAAFRREADRRRFVTASWLLRRVAAAQLSIAPADVVVDRRCAACGGSHGRPKILAGSDNLSVSISHAGNRVAVALCTTGMVGVDIEESAQSSEGVVHWALSEAERRVLNVLPEPERGEGFVCMWVRKEAVLKASGHGLRVSPEKVEVSGPDEEPALLSWPLDPDPGDVEMSHLGLGGDYVGAVAVLGGERPVGFTESNPEFLRWHGPPEETRPAA